MSTATKHTPGPWKHGETTMTRGRIYGDGLLVATLDPPQLDVVDGEFPNQAAIQEEVAMKEADARLIAAAPEMLEALSDLVENFDGVIGVHDLERGSRLRDTARAAIAKATGGDA
jgi:hypothetical protein